MFQLFSNLNVNDACVNNRQAERETESGIIFSAGTAHPAVPQALADMRTDVRMWLYDTLDRSRRTRGRARAGGEEEDGMEEKVLFRPPVRALGETVETRGDRAMIEEERREVGLSSASE